MALVTLKYLPYEFVILELETSKIMIRSYQFQVFKTKIICKQTSARELHGSFTKNNQAYHIRHATLEDIQNIKGCNHRNLPERYESNLLATHVLRWPLFSLVVEYDKNIIGYALGKINRDASIVIPHELIFHTSERYSGHIYSIAIEEPFRRSGIATALMNSVHKELLQVPNLQSINLICRASNTAAIRHYTNRHGYVCKHKLHQYYSDGEDGLFMEWSKYD